VGLQEDIGSILATAGCDGWAAARLLGSQGPCLGRGQDEHIAIASMYKLHVLGAFCLAVDAGAIDPRLRLEVTARAGAPGMIGLGMFDDPVSISIRDLARLMIMVSDSAAAHTLLRIIPQSFLDRVLSSARLHNTTIIVPDIAAAHLPDFPQDSSAASETIRLLAQAPNAPTDYCAYRATSTTKELCRMLDWFFTTDELSTPSRAFAAKVLGQQVFTHRIPSGFPAADVSFAGKTGTIGPIRGETSLISIPGEVPIVVSVVTRSARIGANLPAADVAIGRIARLLVDEIRLAM